jgi:putative DNA primase/helicase
MKRKTPPIVTSNQNVSRPKQTKVGSTDSPQNGVDGPILEVSTLHNIDTDRFELEFRFKALDGERTCRVSRGFKNNLNQIVTELNSSGAIFPKAAGNPKDVVATALDFETKIRRITRQSGWHNNAYVLPGTTVATRDDSDRELTFDAAPHQQTEMDQQRGEFSRWKSGLKGPCEASRHLTFAIALAFAGPLVRLLGSELSEGSIFLLAGQSGGGKTLACLAAQSVFGKAARASVVTFDMTPRACEELFNLHNDGTLVIDEVGRLAATAEGRRQALAWFAYAASSGRGRIRSKKVQSEGLANQRWTVNCLGSTEERIDGDDRRRGEQVRLIQLAVPHRRDGGIFDRAENETTELADRVEKTIEKNYGLALRLFLAALVEDANAQAATLKAFRAFLKLTEAELPGRDRRLASKFALVFAAGMLARNYKLAPWARQGLRESVLTLWREASVTFDGKPLRHMEAARSVQELVSDRRILKKLKRGAPMPKTAIGMNRTLDEQQEIVFYPPRLARALALSVAETDRVMAHFRDKGVLIPHASGSLKQQVRIAGLKQVKPRCYVLDRQKLLDMRFIA